MQNLILLFFYNIVKYPGFSSLVKSGQTT